MSSTTAIGPRCHRCGESCDGSFVYLNGATYHQGCLIDYSLAVENSELRQRLAVSEKRARELQTHFDNCQDCTDCAVESGVQMSPVGDPAPWGCTCVVDSKDTVIGRVSDCPAHASDSSSNHKEPAK